MVYSVLYCCDVSFQVPRNGVRSMHDASDQLPDLDSLKRSGAAYQPLTILVKASEYLAWRAAASSFVLPIVV